MEFDETNCPICYEHIGDDEDYRTPDLTDVRYHPECWVDATRNKGQAFDPRMPAVNTCTGCKKTFDYPPKLHMGVSYCDNCAPEEAVPPTYD
jgi:hypothetical protein